MARLTKEKFNKDTPTKVCSVCTQKRKVYLEIKTSRNNVEESVFCSKGCVKRGFGGIKKPKMVV